MKQKCLQITTANKHCLENNTERERKRKILQVDGILMVYGSHFGSLEDQDLALAPNDLQCDLGLRICPLIN